MVRKGEATPSNLDVRSNEFASAMSATAGAKAALRSPESHPPSARSAKLVAVKTRGDGTLPPSRGTRKLVVRISLEDYERLGLAAVKRDTSRSEIVRQAMEACLQQLTREFRNSCACFSPKD